MKLIKLAIMTAAIAIGSLVGSTSALAGPQPTQLIIIRVDADGYRTVWVCNASGCVVQDHYWTGESQSAQT